MGEKAIAQWESDPRPEAHHRKTRDLTKPGSAFLNCLYRFVKDRVPRLQLSMGFRYQVACWRLGSVSETCIERPHALVTKRSKLTNIGPTKVSLSNRLPLCEKWLRNKQIDVTDLVKAFERARCLKKMVQEFDLSAHPALGDKRRNHRGQLEHVVVGALYNCDVNSMFRSQAVFAKADEKAKGKRDRLDKRLSKEPVSCVPAEENMHRSQMLLHASETMDPKEVYSVRAHTWHSQSFSSVLGTPAAKYRRVETGSTIQNLNEANKND